MSFSFFGTVVMIGFKPITSCKLPKPLTTSPFLVALLALKASTYVGFPFLVPLLPMSDSCYMWWEQMPSPSVRKVY